MECAHEVSYFFGGVFLANAVPHFVSGVMGKPFQSPFAKPPGEGLSSSTVNVLWGFANFVVAYLLIVRVGSFDLHATDHVIAVGVGVLLIGVFVRALVRAVSRRQFNHSLLSGMAKNSMARSTFRSLKVFNFRVWAAGSLVSNIGSWMQRTAQDWVVLTVLTHNNATAVGIIVALQFAPQVLLLPATGFAADHFDKPKLIFATQTAMGLLALGLGLLVVTGFVRLWQVDIFAFLLGCAAAFDMPARQAFISELVGEADLGNALALNSTLFNAARMIGPAAAGLLIAAVGTGAVFLINAASFLAVLAALVSLRRDALHSSDRAGRRPGGLIEGFRYVWQRADLKTILLMLLVVGMFGLNFPIFISTMAVSAFHAGAGQFGFLTSMMALGSVAGALFTARRGNPNMQVLLGGALLFGLACGLAALTPTYVAFGLMLVIAGFAVQTFTTSTNSLVQLSIAPKMRGRVLAILLAIALGGTPVGAPIVGWVADRLGPRAALGVAAASGFVAAMIACVYLVRYSSRLEEADKAGEA